MKAFSHNKLIQASLLFTAILFVCPTLIQACATSGGEGASLMGPVCREHQASLPLHQVFEKTPVIFQNTVSGMADVFVSSEVFFAVFVLLLRIPVTLRDRNRRLQWVWKRARLYVTMSGSPPYLFALHDR